MVYGPVPENDAEWYTYVSKRVAGYVLRHVLTREAIGVHLRSWDESSDMEAKAGDYIVSEHGHYDWMVVSAKDFDEWFE